MRGRKLNASTLLKHPESQVRVTVCKRVKHAHALVGCPREGIDLLQAIAGGQDGLQVLQPHR